MMSSESSVAAISESAKPIPQAARTGMLLLFLCYTANHLCSSIISFLAVPIKIDLHITDLQFGIITGPGFSFTYGVFAFLFAYFADRSNRIKLLVGVLILWSVATAACGLAMTFAQLLVARIVVAIGEAGGTPTTMALVTDSVPRSRLSSAFSILMLAAPLGYLIAAVAGSYFAGEFGWRWTFVLCGLLGLPLAVLVRWKVHDPRNDAAVQVNSTTISFAPLKIVGGIISSLKVIFQRRSVVLIMMGFAWSSYVGAVLPNWMAIFLNRYHGYSGPDAALHFGIAFVGGVVPGLLCGGFIADRLARISPTWQINVPVLALIFSSPLFVVAFHAQSAVLSLAIFAMGIFVSQLGLAPTLGAFNSALPTRVRATGTATLLLASALIAGGVGNLAIGALSDLLAQSYGRASLRIGLSIIIPCFAAISIACLLLARRTFASDLDRTDHYFASS